MFDPKAYRKKREDDGHNFDGPNDPYPKPRDGFISEELEDEIGLFVGVELYHSSKKKTPGWLVRWVVPEGPRAGQVIEDTFWLTEKAMGRIYDLSVHLGATEPFDPKDKDDMSRMMGAPNAVACFNVRAEDYVDRKGQDRTAYRLKWYRSYQGDLPSGEDDPRADEWNGHLDAAVEDFKEYLEWRGRNPRKERKASADDRRKGGRGKQPPPQDDDIPF